MVWIGHAGEDALDYTVRPRFEVAGADLDRVTAYDTDDDKSLAAVCRSAAERQPRPLLAVIDSWAAWVTDGDNNSPESVRCRFRALLPLQRAAVGVLLITHTRKMAPEGNQLDTVSGNRQVTAIPRMVLEVQNGGVYQTKGNLGGKGPDIGFSVESAVIEAAGGNIETSRMCFLETAPPALETLPNDGITVDDVCAELTAEGAPEQPTITALRTLFDLKTKPSRKRLEKVLWTAIRGGRITLSQEKVKGRVRTVYRPANGAGG